MEVRLSHRIDEIDPARWDAVVGRDYPFLRHPFLQALEASGAVSVETGWQPLHLTLWEQERLLGLMPLYL
ncbi:MAG TPA: peptidogalycan biosysnthesis protein, partial [Pseudomonadales bacterium]|nr:peptidogalycan biosysnthesis protein [Pseudomonadales bacterium]